MTVAGAGSSASRTSPPPGSERRVRHAVPPRSARAPALAPVTGITDDAAADADAGSRPQPGAACLMQTQTGQRPLSSRRRWMFRLRDHKEHDE